MNTFLRIYAVIMKLIIFNIGGLDHRFTCTFSLRDIERLEYFRRITLHRQFMEHGVIFPLRRINKLPKIMQNGDSDKILKITNINGIHLHGKSLRAEYSVTRIYRIWHSMYGIGLHTSDFIYKLIEKYYISIQLYEINICDIILYRRYQFKLV